MMQDLMFVAALGQLTIQLLFLIFCAMAIMAATLLAVSVMAQGGGPVNSVEPDEGFPDLKADQ